MRSEGTSASAAFSHPFPSHSSCPGAWASVSIDTKHPAADGGAQERFGRVEALGP